jgi:hypothetical protein
MNYNLDGVTRDHLIEIHGQVRELPTPNCSWSYIWGADPELGEHHKLSI